MSRPDQSIAFLRSYGYSVFRFPRASALPLELMHREGKDLTRLGMVPDLVTAGDAPAPDVRRDASPGSTSKERKPARLTSRSASASSAPSSARSAAGSWALMPHSTRRGRSRFSTQLSWRTPSTSSHSKNS